MGVPDPLVLGSSGVASILLLLRDVDAPSTHSHLLHEELVNIQAYW